MSFKDEIKKISSDIWTKFTPFLKDTALSEEEVQELIKTSETLKYDVPDVEPKLRLDTSYWKSATDYYGYHYSTFMIRTVELKQREIRRNKDAKGL